MAHHCTTGTYTKLPPPSSELVAELVGRQGKVGKEQVSRTSFSKCISLQLMHTSIISGPTDTVRGTHGPTDTVTGAHGPTDTVRGCTRSY